MYAQYVSATALEIWDLWERQHWANNYTRLVVTFTRTLIGGSPIRSRTHSRFVAAIVVVVAALRLSDCA